MDDAKPIVDQALGAGRPWWQACCLGCGIFFFAVMVTAAWFVHAVKGPGMQSLTRLPSNMPARVQLYKAADARAVRYLPATQKIGVAERLLAPLRLLGIVASSTGTLAPRKVGEIEVFNADTLLVDWGAMQDVRSTDVVTFYKKMLESAGFMVQTTRDEMGAVDIVAGDRPDANVQVDVKGSSGQGGIDEIRVVMNYVAE